MDRRFSKRVEAAFRSVLRLCRHRPSLGVIAGSGLAGFAEKIDGTVIPYRSIRGFPEPSVEGHPGVLTLGERVAVFAGRFHLYEGRSVDEVILPVALLHALGARRIIITNAAGGIRADLSPGAIVLIRDQINLTGENPLRGRQPQDGGKRFVDMTDAYSQKWRDRIKIKHPDITEGVYAGVLGPSYETPAEIRMLEAMGADLVGMSTVTETIAARFYGLEVVGVSLVANRAAGKAARRPVTHGDVLAAGAAAGAELTEFLFSILDILSEP